MRKLLLASAALLGASLMTADFADAQALGKPDPGTVTVRLNGRVRFYAYGAFDRDVDNNPAVGAARLGPNAGTNKQSNYGFAEYGRLYPGFDGQTANGLKYGASLEIRQDLSSPAGGGSFGSISGADPQRAGLYFRRVWGYIGADNVGTLRLGATDQPTSLYLTGNFENFDSGGFNGDVPGISGAALVAWPFSDVGSYYTTNKAVYLSPQLYGFDLGVSYEPSTANVSGGNNCPGGISAPGCDRLSSTPTNLETARRKNTVDALVRYRGTFAGFGIAATGAYIGGSHVTDDSNIGGPYNSNPLTTSSATGSANLPRYNYQGLNAGDFGLAVTYAGFSVGGHYTFGQFNGNVANTLPDGYDNGEAWLGGASYTIGPVVVGAHYLYNKSAGNLSNDYFGRQRTEQGAAVGATYTVAPGLALSLSGIYGIRKQNGYNFVTGAGVNAANPNGNPNNNKIVSTLIYFGTLFSW